MTNALLLPRVRAIIAALFAIQEEAISPATSQSEVEKWDSLGHLSLVLELESEFGVQFAPEQVERMVSVALVVRELEAELEQPESRLRSG